MMKGIAGVMIMGLLSFNLSSCAMIVQRIKYGDGTWARETPITAERIARLVTGKSTDMDMKQIFDNSLFSQETYARRSLKKKYKGKDYTIDRIIVVQYGVRTDQDLGNGVVRYDWTDRIYLAAFFYKSVLQYYTVTHDKRDESGKTIWGPLDTGGNDKNQFYPNADCDSAQYRVIELGRKDKYDLRKLKECGIPLDGE